ncbi:MAG TPA: energy transducer TonB [Blastocatellia bacterium]|nr:energy transducer TonB [Blastocatellia bacterium]
MEKVALKSKGTEPNPDRIIWIIPWPGLVARLARALAETVHEVASGPLSYLRAAFLPDRTEDSFWVRLATLVAASIAHPLQMIRGAVAVDSIDLKRRRRFYPILTVSVAAHGVFIAYLVYQAFFSQFAHLRVVNKAYKKFDPDALMVKLFYPPQMLRPTAKGPAMSLEEIRARVEKRKRELELAREKAEKERQEKEAAERKAAEEAAKVAEQNKSTQTKFGEINIAPIKDTVGNIAKLFEEGGLDIPEVKFSVMAGFKVMPDGSFQDIRIIKSSGSKIIDRNALEILSNIGESHALGPVSNLTSSTISLEITDELARIRIMAFAPTAEIAKEKSGLLNALFWALRMKETSPELGQLLKLIKVKSEGKRVDTDLLVPRAKAAEMFRAWLANPSQPPQ